MQKRIGLGTVCSDHREDYYFCSILLGDMAPLYIRLTKHVPSSATLLWGSVETVFRCVAGYAP